MPRRAGLVLAAIFLVLSVASALLLQRLGAGLVLRGAVSGLLVGFAIAAAQAGGFGRGDDPPSG
ncbi:MAG: hypothetical protein M3P46_03565 [Actinomycetota bacterium]|nr:hypothetical protein [Actinomycetota bacterium]